MVVCRFYQQGHCRYGDRCWNEHPGGGNQAFGGQQKHISFSQQNKFEALASASTGSSGGTNVKLKDLNPQETVEVLCKEIQLWEKSKLWPFSCVAVSKEAQNLPGFEDISTEELRLEAYTAKANNTLPAYQQKVAQLTAEYKAKREELQRPSLQVKQKLIAVIEDIKRSEQNVSTGGLFGQAQSNNTFGAASSPLFGGTQTTTNKASFGQPSSELFGQSSTATTGTSGGLFGTSATSGGLFGQPSTQNSNTFGQTGFAANAVQPGTFGASSSTGGGLFGSPAATTAQQASGNTGLFGKPSTGSTSTGLFGKPTTTSTSTGLFGKPSSDTTNAGAGLFGKPATGSSTQLFGKPGAFGTPNPSASGVFGGGQTTASVASSQSALPITSTSSVTPAAQATTAVNASKIYTPMDQLTSAEKEQFESQKFSLGNIPIRPPANEFCV
ncbi:unnamed protein product [Owenia fusiformis]|uniref:Nucleoporin NUP42 n=1 Tax=Owenia fusiformis TaxID=6347 RepID=A0A8J1UDM4_OWEFU|nr:unnamed protein product [Owenia fusiformis]